MQPNKNTQQKDNNVSKRKRKRQSSVHVYTNVYKKDNPYKLYSF